jgi:AcrR family transcriptional regulator
MGLSFPEVLLFFHSIVDKSRRVGRPSLTRERRRQIVEAFLECVAEEGMRHASIVAVANRLGLDRTTIHHYFRTREELVGAAMEQVIASYRRGADNALLEVAPEERASALVDHLFGAGFNDPTLAAVLLEFSVVARTDAKAMRPLRRAYRAFEDAVLGELEKCYPRAPARDLRRIAYAIVQLSEGSSAFREMGFASDRSAAARAAARSLLRELEFAAKAAQGSF